MLLVLIHYLKPIAEVQRARQAHRAFLHEQYRAGLLVCSGPRVDETGGVVLARGGSKAEVEALFSRDPYALSGVARHEVIEFELKSHAPGFEAFLARPVV